MRLARKPNTIQGHVTDLCGAKDGNGNAWMDQDTGIVYARYERYLDRFRIHYLIGNRSMPYHHLHSFRIRAFQQMNSRKGGLMAVFDWKFKIRWK